MKWANAGFCVLPTKHHDKSPAVNTWKQYVRPKGSDLVPAAPSPQIVDRWFSTEQTGLGLILGATSGNAEMFEFEGRAIEEGLFQDFGAFADTNGAGETWARLKAGYVERTPSGGLHFVFRVTGGRALPNTRLAGRPSNEAELVAHPDQPIQVLIETRGEGGFVVIAPTYVLSNGGSRWSHIPAGEHGRWVTTGLGEIVTLTAVERDQLYAVARMFDSVPEYVRKEALAPREKIEGKLSPLDDFRARTDWADILEPEGWTFVGNKSDGRDCWLRPGKDTNEGWGLSATTRNTDGISDSLYVFSTSTDLPCLQGLSKEFVWAHYNAGGDFAEATRMLAEQDYGDGDESWRKSKVEKGNVNPFSEGFDPEAWGREKSREREASLRASEAATQSNDALATQSDDEIESPFLDWFALWDEPEEDEWLVPGLIPARSQVALYSAPKLGKSLLLLEMAVHVSRGTRFLGAETEKTVVLYVDHENDPRGDIRKRLRAMGFGPNDLAALKYMSFPRMATLDTEAGGAELIRHAAQVGAGLVVIDTISRTIAGEENSNDTWLQFYRHTGRILKDAGIALVRLDHTGKDETKGQRGGSAKSGDVDAIWQLIKLDRNKFMMKMDGGRKRFPEETISFQRLDNPTRSERLHGATRTPDGSFEADQSIRVRIAKDIINMLRVPGTDGMGTSQIGKVVKGKDATVLQVLERLIDQDFVVRTPDGKNGHLNRWNDRRASAWHPDNPFGPPVS